MRTAIASTLLFLALINPGRSQAITTDDLKTARPETLLNNMYAACQLGNQEQMFSQHSKSFEQALLKAPANKRSEIFAVYCQGIRELVDKQLKGKTENASYSIKESDRTNQGLKKSILCIAPKLAPSESCRFGFDVTIENGQLKKHEF